jgi:hypothetical protein
MEEVDGWKDVGEALNIPLSVKATVDLLTRVTEFTGFRREFLLRKLEDEANQSTADRGKLFEKLNCGSVEATGSTQLRFKMRTDYVGIDVDRFFRIANHALPGLVLVGDSLYDLMDQVASSPTGVSTEDDHFVRNYPIAFDDRGFFEKHPEAGFRAPSSSRTISLNWLKRESPPLKGVESGYGFRYLYGSSVSELRRSHDSHSEERSGAATIDAAAHFELLEKMFNKLKERHV